MTSGFEITQGDASSAVILHVPHSSTRIPNEVRERMTLSDEELQRELLRITDKIAKAFADFGTVGVNEPFIGIYVPLEQYGTNQRVSSVMIEIRRDL